ncbi:Peptide methionine sulfoxide reductase, partial [Linum perenne]
SSSRNSEQAVSGESNWLSRESLALPRPKSAIHKVCYTIQAIRTSVLALPAILRLLGFSMILRSGNDVGTQYRSGIYYYNPEQEKAANESKERHQKLYNRNIVTEILPAKKFYRAEEYHQQYLAKGGRLGLKQSAEKGCNDPIRCYG